MGTRGPRKPREHVTTMSRARYLEAHGDDAARATQLGCDDDTVGASAKMLAGRHTASVNDGYVGGHQKRAAEKL